MKHSIILISILLQCFTSLCFGQASDAIIGVWQSEHGSGRIQIYKNGTEYQGKLVGIKEAGENGKPVVDINNPSEKLKGRPLLGADVLKDFKYASNGLWEGGTVYDPRSGKTYSGKLLMDSNEKLEIRAFVGISLIGKSQIWSRVK